MGPLALANPAFYLFFLLLLLKLGFLDGKEGFIYFFMMDLWYPLLVDGKYLELMKGHETNEPVRLGC